MTSLNRYAVLRSYLCLGSCLGLCAALLLVAGCPTPAGESKPRVVTNDKPPVSCRLEQVPKNLQGKRYNDQTFAVMKRVLRADSTAVDVGAFKGNVLFEMIKAAPRGTHHAFEPIPKMAAFVRKRFPSPLIKVHEMALGNRTGTATFQLVSTNPAYSGLKRRGYPTKKEIITPIKVRLDTLDNVLPANAKVAFIKADVEGGEYNVFEGAKKIILRDRPVIVFEHGGAARGYGVSSEKMYRLLHDAYGLKVNLMSCWLKGERGLTLAEFKNQYKAARNYYYIAYPPQKKK